MAIVFNALQKSRILEQVEHSQNRINTIARTDELTKLQNRRCFEQALEKEMAKTQRYQTPLSIMIIDFDHFKHLNEKFGYEEGDRILTVSAALIEGMARELDIVCRYGGEEFGIVLPNTGLEGARILAERIRKKLAGHDFSQNNQQIKVSNCIHQTLDNLPSF